MALDSKQACTDEVVICVHGTYANRSSDEGASWWQQGSAVWRGLCERLPKGVCLPVQGELFHWSGDNSERSRIKAARHLLDYLLRLESDGRPYHLVGHSHGGSVIWHTLRMAMLRRNPLQRLRSWSTVGTPFLHHRTQRSWHLMSLFKILLAIALIKPAVTTLVKFSQLVSAALIGTDHGVRLPSDGGTGWIAQNRGLATKVAEFCGLPMQETAEGLRVGTFDPSSQTIVEYVFLTWEGWLILSIALGVAYVYLNLAKFCISPVLESFRIRAEERFEGQVMSCFQGRWLGLWSREDEAINSLRATLELSVSFVSEIAQRDSVLVSDRIGFISRPHNWLLAPIFNRVFRPILNQLVQSLVVKTAQGNNRPSAEVVAVSPAPVSVDSMPQLPAALNAAIVENANRHARDIAPKLRELLASTSVISGLEAFGDSLSGREMIHTSYFDHPEILDLLAMHVASSSTKTANVKCSEATRNELQIWLDQFREQFHEAGKSGELESEIPRLAA